MKTPKRREACKHPGRPMCLDCHDWMPSKTRAEERLIRRLLPFTDDGVLNIDEPHAIGIDRALEAVAREREKVKP